MRGMVGTKQSEFSDTDFSAELLILKHSKTISISLIISNLEENLI